MAALSKRDVPSRNGGPGFIVIKYYEEFTLGVPNGGAGKDKFPQWGKVTIWLDEGRYHTHMVQIERNEALQLIREYGLVRSHQDPDGIVYDTPSRLFHKDWQGEVTVPKI